MVEALPHRSLVELVVQCAMSLKALKAGPHPGDRAAGARPCPGQPRRPPHLPATKHTGASAQCPAAARVLLTRTLVVLLRAGFARLPAPHSLNQDFGLQDVLGGAARLCDGRPATWASHGHEQGSPTRRPSVSGPSVFDWGALNVWRACAIHSAQAACRAARPRLLGDRPPLRPPVFPVFQAVDPTTP